jgi:hypothetical protein
MSDFEDLQNAIDKLEVSDEVKNSLRIPGKALNTQLGVRGSDIINIKSELEKSQGQVTTYKDFADAMGKHNMKVEDIKKMAGLAGIEQTHQDEKDELVRVAKEAQLENKNTQAELKIFRQEQTLGPKIDQAVENFKDAEGKSIKLMPTTVKDLKAKLFDGIKEGYDEVIIDNLIGKALQEGQASQLAFLKENGLVSSNKEIHLVDENNLSGSGSGSVLDGSKIREVLVAGRGSTDSAAMAMAMARQMKQ